MIASQPISSPVSSKMQAAPAATSLSKAMPAAGLPVMPEVPSDPPQTVPTISSETSIGTVGASAKAATCSATQARPAAMVDLVPPLFWITSTLTGRPVALTTASTWWRLKLSQPRLTRSTAPTLGWVHSRSIIFCA